MQTELHARLDELQPALISDIQRLIAHPSVEAIGEGGTPYGLACKAALDEALALCRSFGFSTGNMDDRVGWAEWGEGDEMIAVLGHLDVVPAGEGWTVCPPFAPVVQGGKLYGRGSIDDKGPVMAAVYAARALKETGFVPARRVRLLFGCAEETGSSDMKYYREHGGELPTMGFTPDGSFPLINGEKGIITACFERPLHQNPGTGRLLLRSLRGGQAHNVVPDHASAELSGSEWASLLPQKLPPHITVSPTEHGFVVEATGVSAHGSTPQKGQNAIGRLCLFLDTLPLAQDAAEAVHFLACRIGMETDGAALGIALEDEVSGKLTLNLGVAESEPNRFGNAALLRVRLNYRNPVTFRNADAAVPLNAAFAAAGWQKTSELAREGLYIPADSPLCQKLLAVYRAHTGDDTPPMAIGGGTYAKSMPNLLAFGPVFPGEEAREHQPDEFIDLESLRRLTHILADAIKALAE